MYGLSIVVMILAMLSKAAIGAMYLLQLAKKKNLGHIVVPAALGGLLLGDIMMLVAVKGTVIFGLVLYLLGWPALAAGFGLIQFGSFAAAKQALTAQAAPEKPAQGPPSEA